MNVGIAAGSASFGGFACYSTASCRQSQGLIRATYVNFDHCGTSTPATNVCWGAYPYNSGDSAYCDHCTFTNSGVIMLWGNRNGVTWQFNNSTIKSPVLAAASNSKCNSCSLQLFANFGPTSTPTGVTYEVKNSYIEGAVRHIGGTGLAGASAGFVFQDNVFAGNTGGTSGVDAPFNTGATFPGASTWTNNLLYFRVSSSAANAELPAGTLTNTIALLSSNLSNFHFLSIKGSQSQTSVYDGTIGERATDDGSQAGASDFFNPISHFNNSGAQPAITLKHTLLIPTPGGQPMSSLVNDSSGSSCNGTTIICPLFTVTNNTYRGDDEGNLVVGAAGEINPGYAGLYTNVSCNLVWRAASGAGWVTRWTTPITMATGNYTTADYNGYWNVTGIRYFESDTQPGAYTNAPGTHDINANPDFVDASRRFLGWAQSVDGTVATWADALADFSKMNDDSGSVAGFTVAAAHTWIRAGWSPKQASFKAACNDGSDIGAVPVALRANNSVSWR